MSEAADSSPSAQPRGGRSRRLLLGLLVFPIVLATTATFTGTALAPKLLNDAPLLLVALNPVSRHLVLASTATDFAPFVAVALARLFFPDPFYYVIGRLWGQDAIRWIERRLGGAGRWIGTVERLFARAGWLVLMVAPVGFICVLAGASRMSVKRFLFLNLSATLAWVLVVRRLGDALSRPINVVREFVADNVLALTIASVVLVTWQLYSRSRRARRGARGQGKDEVVE